MKFAGPDVDESPIKKVQTPSAYIKNGKLPSNAKGIKSPRYNKAKMPKGVLEQYTTPI